MYAAAPSYVEQPHYVSAPVYSQPHYAEPAQRYIEPEVRYVQMPSETRTEVLQRPFDSAEHTKYVEVPEPLFEKFMAD